MRKLTLPRCNQACNMITQDAITSDKMDINSVLSKMNSLLKTSFKFISKIIILLWVCEVDMFFSRIQWWLWLWEGFSLASQKEHPQQIEIMKGDITSDAAISSIINLIRERQLSGIIINAGDPPAMSFRKNWSHRLGQSL